MREVGIGAGSKAWILDIKEEIFVAIGKGAGHRDFAIVTEIIRIVQRHLSLKLRRVLRHELIGDIHIC